MSPVDRQPPAGDDSLAQVIERGRASSGDLTGATLGDFRVERLLGRGGMGEVYLATQMSLNRPAALKVLRSDVLAKPGYGERLESEALAVAKLNHPSIVHVYSMAEIDGLRFIAMEYVEGTNLRDYVARKGALDLRQAFSIMKQTAQAIGAAGEAGIIHRDVKPENILLDRRGRVKVADFGLCRQMDDSGPQITQVGITMGTPAYMSPEQAQGHSLDHRSDLYSLGATFYFMLAATPPFRGDSPVAVALKQVREIPSSLLVHRPDLPVEVDRLVMKLMAKNPADRFQSAAEMLAELARLRETVPLPPPGAADASDRGMARTEEIAATAAYPAPAIRERDPAPAAKVQPARASAAPVAKVDADDREAAAAAGGPGFSGLIAGVIVAVGLCAGGLAGWAARAPDVASMPDESSQRPPALWIEPRWAAIPNKGNAEEQFRYALLAAPRDEWPAAWLAVPGHHPRSHEAASKAYVQLARLWYRRDDVESLAALASGLVAWKDSQKRDKDLAALILLAIDLKKGDLGAVEKGFEKLSGGEVADLYDASLVALNLEVCTDALRTVQKSGIQTIEEPLRRAFRRLVWQMNRVEMGGPLRAGNPGAASAPRSKG